MRRRLNLADRIMVLDQGGSWAEGTPTEIGANEAVQAALSRQGRMSALTRRLHTYYGKSHILHGVSLEVARAGSPRCSAQRPPARRRRCAASSA